MNTMNYLLIDTSYTIFYRYFATLRWYKFVYPDDHFMDDYKWFNNEIFKNMFIKQYKKSFEKIIKKYSIPNNHIIFVIDCSRKDIWRNMFYDKYKSNRDYRTLQINDFFKYVYDTIILNLINTQQYKMLKYSQLEADDIIYLTKKYIRKLDNNHKIIIISSDTDLIQLIDNNTFIYNLQNKCINYKCGDVSPNEYLEIKIICGDVSDNINSCFLKCGQKTAIKLIKNKHMLLDKFRKNKNSFQQYTLNRILIDLKNIPIHLVIPCNQLIKNIIK